jgi:trk system potassium uptake protein TrkA
MRTLIVGAGRLGLRVAEVLSAAGNDVVLVDRRPIELHRAGRDPAVRAVTGDACEPFVLEDAGARNADLLVAATGEDENNLVISLLAKRRYDVSRVVARVNDPDNGWLFDDKWGVDVAVPAEESLLALIEEATGARDTVALLRLGAAGVDLVETRIGASSSAAGRRLCEIDLPGGCVVAVVVRNSRPTVPDADWVLHRDDELLVVAQSVGEQEVRAAFQ